MNKKINIIFALILFSSQIFAQENKFQIGLTFSPNYSFRTYDFDNSSVDNNTIIIRNIQESSIFGFNLGINSVYKLNDKFNLEIALQYSKNGDKIVRNVNPEDQIQFVGIAGSYSKFVYTINNNYLDIPIKINYNFITKNKLNIFATAGISNTIFINSNFHLKETLLSGSIVEFKGKSGENLNRLNIQAIIGLGLNYELNQNFILRFQPVFRKSILPIQNTPIKGFYSSLGTSFGIFWKI